MIFFETQCILCVVMWLCVGIGYGKGAGVIDWYETSALLTYCCYNYIIVIIFTYLITILCVGIGYRKGAWVTDRHETRSRGGNETARERLTREAGAHGFTPQAVGRCQKHQHWHEQQTPGTNETQLTGLPQVSKSYRKNWVLNVWEFDVRGSLYNTISPKSFCEQGNHLSV